MRIFEVVEFFFVSILAAIVYGHDEKARAKRGDNTPWHELPYFNI